MFFRFSELLCMWLMDLFLTISGTFPSPSCFYSVPLLLRFALLIPFAILFLFCRFFLFLIFQDCQGSQVCNISETRPQHWLKTPLCPTPPPFSFFVSLVPFILPSPVSTSSPLPDPSSCANPFSTFFRLLCLIWFRRTREDIKLPVSGRLIVHVFDRDIPCSPIVLWPGIPSFRDTRCLSRTFGVVVCFQHPYFYLCCSAFVE